MTSREVKGNTLRVYLYLLKHEGCELREVQRNLGLSTASLASYHLNRLIEGGYARQDEQGRYVGIKEASGELLAGYAKIGPAIVPQLSFFAVLFTILTAFFAFEALYAQGYVAYIVAVAVAMVIVMWYETVRLWRRLVS